MPYVRLVIALKIEWWTLQVLQHYAYVILDIMITVSMNYVMHAQLSVRHALIISTASRVICPSNLEY